MDGLSAFPVSLKCEIQNLFRFRDTHEFPIFLSRGRLNFDCMKLEKKQVHLNASFNKLHLPWCYLCKGPSSCIRIKLNHFAATDVTVTSSIRHFRNDRREG